MSDPALEPIIIDEGPPPPQDLKITEQLVFEIPLPVAQSPPPPTSMSLKGMASVGTGTWEATEPFVDGGAASEAEVVIGGRTVHTNTTLQGAGGSIEIDARFHFAPGSSTAEGNFIIVGGTGGYENLHGSGTVTSSFTLEFIPPASLLLTVCNTLEGRAFFTP